MEARLRSRSSQGADVGAMERDPEQDTKVGGQATTATRAVRGHQGLEVVSIQRLIPRNVESNVSKQASPSLPPQLHQNAPLARTPPEGQSLVVSHAVKTPYSPVNTPRHLKGTPKSPRGSSQSPSYQPDLRGPTPIAEYSSMGGKDVKMLSPREHQDSNPLDPTVEGRIKDPGPLLTDHFTPLSGARIGTSSPPPTRPVPPAPPPRRDTGESKVRMRARNAINDGNDNKLKDPCVNVMFYVFSNGCHSSGIDDMHPAPGIHECGQRSNTTVSFSGIPLLRIRGSHSYALPSLITNFTCIGLIW